MSKIFFLYSDERIEVERSPLTGSEIKAAIKSHVASLDLSHDLILEGQGNEADRVVKDDETVDLTHGHGEAPKRFFTRPPTNFGHA
jgi:hypothetical protein